MTTLLRWAPRLRAVVVRRRDSVTVPRSGAVWAAGTANDAVSNPSIAPLATLAEASMTPNPPARAGESRVLVSSGGKTAKIPGRIKRLIAEKPTTIEARIRKMLELEKFMKQTGIRLELKQTKSWYIPGLDAELQRELEDLDAPDEHPAFWKRAHGYLLFRRDTRDWYRNLRVLIGSDGPPACRLDIMQELLQR